MQFSTDCCPPNLLLVIPFHDNDGWTQCGLSHNYNAFINIGTINVFYIVLLIFFCSVIFYVYLNIIQSTPTCLVIKCSKVICTTRSPSLFLILSAASKLSYRSSASRLCFFAVSAEFPSLFYSFLKRFLHSVSIVLFIITTILSGQPPTMYSFCGQPAL